MIMFLIRTSFWLCLIVLILPVDKDEVDPAVTQSINAKSAIELASGTLSDLSDFCVRKPDVCQQGYEALSAFGVKAQYVSGLAYTYLHEKLGEKPADIKIEEVGINTPQE